MSGPTINVNFTLTRVESGGNTGNGQYFYSFGPDIVNVDTADTTINYIFDADTPPQFRITDVFTTDARNQLTKIQIATDGRSVSILNANTVQQLTFLSFMTLDTSNNTKINCDPQMTNRPGTGGGGN